MEGVVIKALPNFQFTVEIEETGQTVTGYVSGKMRQNFIRLTEGDIVTVELSVYDLDRGRITFRQR